MKLPGLTPGVSFTPKSQLRLILPATNNKEKTKFSSSGFHTSSPHLHAGFL